MLTRKFKLLLGVMIIVLVAIVLLDNVYQSLITFKWKTIFACDSDVQLRIIAIVGNRALSLKRLLNSLNNASYFEDNVVLDIWIDRSKDRKVDKQTLEVANSFHFLHGTKYIHIQPSYAGVYGQWIYTWNVSDLYPEIAVILEDDIEVSPFFYKWLKMVHNKYDSYDNINGYSLHGRCENHALIAPRNKYIHVPKNNTVFLYPAFNTWGFSPHTKHWLHFVNWVTLKSNDTTFKPSIANIEPTIAYEIARSRGTVANNWDFLHLYHAYVHKLFTVFPNIQGDRGLSVHWKEKGLHYPENRDKKSSGDLLQNWIPEIESLPDSPLYFDFAGRNINPKNYQWP
ncbi:hypothetical protein CHS0354_042714 [Potamilus streckersoni]|uniref:Uncharacterized protein n=1 Tax=Potamilus streckersoni TaxID=2493646 RepID=A0AAE0SAD9_9BIVA|nr:hypothetical protein CHS0354_042714 [Potamilus streckersoni]